MDRGPPRDVPERRSGGRISPVDTPNDPFGARAPLPGHPDLGYYRLTALDEQGVASTARLPYTVRVLLEMLLRNAGGVHVSEADVRALANWPAPAPDDASVPFLPARVILQDFTGVPAVVDLAAMRAADGARGARRERGRPARAGRPGDRPLACRSTPSAPASPTPATSSASTSATSSATRCCAGRSGAFDGFRVVPPGMGIVHQVNLEHLGRVVQLREDAQGAVAVPDTLVGTDSHTTMIDALGILGWGVGGIEAEAVLLGEPLVLRHPDRRSASSSAAGCAPA